MTFGKVKNDAMKNYAGQPRVNRDCLGQTRMCWHHLALPLGTGLHVGDTTVVERHDLYYSDIKA